jgi:D-alanyl-D-alanine carboxypeptidase/D-alanyl-D-alanine-endopeptidase (penicillin-binding protein 4)
MKNLALPVIMLLIAISPGCTSIKAAKSSTKSAKAHIAHEVEEIIKAIDPHVNIGIKIACLNSDEIIFEKNASRHFIPGSTIKLVTLASALHYLGPSHRFRTALATDGFAKEASVIENLFIQGSGDPDLMDHDLISLAHELKQMGITKILGDIYVDDQIFDDVLWGRGAMWDDLHRGFSAPISGLNLNYNRLLIKTVPAHVMGDNAHVIVSPASSFIEVHSRVRTLDKGASQNLSLSIARNQGQEQEWPLATNDGLRHGDKIFINGQTTKNSLPHYSSLAISDPAMLAGAFLKDHLVKLGIKVSGNISRKAAPAKAIKLASHESRALAEALIDFTKASNNVANDALVKAIAAESGVRPASFSAGLRLINEFLDHEVGIKSGSLITADGAGTSRYNLITPEQMVKLLTYAASRFHMGPEFMAALPIAGEDGTLRSRLRSDFLKGNIRAKTGSLSGVSSLAGYFIAEDGLRYAFAIMINGFIGASSKYTRMQNDILALLMREDKTQLAKVK